jgi:hypothetical protein
MRRSTLHAEPSESLSDPQVPNSYSHLQGRQAAKKRKGVSVFVYIIALMVAAVILMALLSRGTLSPPSQQLQQQQQQQQQMNNVPINTETKQIQEPTNLPVPTETGTQVQVPAPAPAQEVQEVQEVDMVQSPTTVVTGYFSIRSKYGKDSYIDWMSTMLGLNDPMIIFTSPDMVDTIKELRAHAINRTLVIPMELQDLPLVKKYPLAVWQAELDKDPEKKRHAGYQVFWIWLSKTWFLQQSVERNPFSSTTFMWSDIGCFRGRDQKWKGRTMMGHPEILVPGRMLFMAHHKPNPPSSIWWTNKLKDKDHFYHSGTMMAGTSDTILKFHVAFLQTFQGFLDRSLFVGDDQTVLQSTCLQNPDLCSYAPTSQVPSDNHYFGLRTVLWKGGDYKLWFPPSLAPRSEPKAVINDQKKKEAVLHNKGGLAKVTLPPVT